MEQYRQTASKAQGRADAEMNWPKTEAECPRWNPNYTAGCLEVVRARAAKEQARLAELRADKPRQDQLIIQGIMNRMESGHDAGYDWARDHNIDSESGCRGESSSFNEGCRRYAEERELGEN
ncbi:hypothetical protein [Caulobacter hibisci]|uniref:Uncharacterized protein n=1 Tax=Caulobacter hibisci TaxID=2035993 RepID=A0ABS0T0G6_9CAUL|nr:hypothetical protein [Caulobacter hibisci]MBI1685392.1 hypothetical protein [Caulobacter hibisci]